MNPALAVNLIAVVISVSAVVVSALFAVRQLRLMRRSNETLVAIELLTRECRTTEFLESEDFVVHQLPRNPPEDGVGGLSPAARQHVNRVGLYYSSLGFLSVFGGIQERMVISLMPWRARRAWFALEPYIRRERALRSPTYLAYFEHLVCMIAEADLAEIHATLQLRKIGDRSARFKREFLAGPDTARVAADASAPHRRG